MATRTTMGRLLVNEALPEDMRDDARVLDKKGINTLLRDLAEKHPDKYVEVSKKLNDIGRTVATEFGGYSFGLEHLKTSQIAQKNRAEIQTKVAQILGNERLTPDQRKAAIVKVVGGYQQKQIDGIYDEAVKANNPLALQVVSGSRGNKMNLGSLLGGDMLYSDHRDEVIPLPVLSSYSEGLKPMEYWASTYGARRGTMATKFATQDAGFLSKQLNQVAHRLMIVGDEDDRDIPNRGLPVDTDDGDNEGALLAKDFGPYKRNTVLTPKILKHIKGLGHDRILVRSPLVGGSPDGGVYARDVGVRERGVLPGRGEQVGLTAAQALSEPLSQGQLSAKHSGGVAGQEKAVGGFAYINQLIQVPKKGKGWAAHSEHDGTVSSIEPAPAGGSYVWIGDKRHYVPAGAELKVKKGDAVEAGDVLSDGFPNPQVVTDHKGVGEGKRYFVNAMREAMLGAGMKVNRRNVELLARGLINHVTLTDEMGDHVPDDVIPYSTMEHIYEPREDHETTTPDRALGKYLERPVLHYSIGTKVRPSVLKELQHFGVDAVAVHRDPPPFKSHMIRGMYSLQNDPDWMTRMYGSGLKESLTEATHRGRVSDELGTSFVPGLSRAVEFGQVGSVRQPEPGTKLPPEGQPFGDPRAKPALNLPKPATTPSPTSAPDPKKPKTQGFFSGLFKMSEDDLEKEAAMLLAKPVQQIRMAGGVRPVRMTRDVRPIRMTKTAETPPAPKVDTTTPGNTGSSTASSNQTAIGPVPGGPTPTPGPVTAPTPTMTSPTPGGPVPAPAPPPQPAGPPGGPTTPAPTGQVHPGRLEPGMIGSNPWGSGIGSANNAPYRVNNPNAFAEGFTPGEGMFGQMDDPAMAAQFVHGNGYGGQLGEVTRFGSLLDSRAIAGLTSGQAYVDNGNKGEGHDSLIGGQPMPPIHGGMNWGGLLDKPVAPGPAAPAQEPRGIQGRGGAPLPMGTQTGLGGPSPTQGFQNPNFLIDEIARGSGWGPGNKQFDEAKKAMGPNATDQEVMGRLVNMQRRAFLFEKGGYAPGQPKFEEERKKLHSQVLEKIGGNVDQAIAGLQQTLSEFQASNPQAPEISQIQQQLQQLQQFKEKGIEDGDVMDHIMTTMDPEGEISDYQLLRELKGQNSTTHNVMRAYLSPVTGTFAARLTGKTAAPVLKGLHAGLTKTPLVNRVPGFRPPVPTAAAAPTGKVVAKTVLKEGEEAAAKAAVAKAEKMGLKAVAKKIPYVGIVVEVVDVANHSPDELRAKFNDKMNQEATAGNIAWYFADNVLNIGTNLAGAGLTAMDAMNLYAEAKAQDRRGDYNQAAHMQTAIKYWEDVARKRQLSPEEQARLDKARQKVSEIDGRHITTSGFALRHLGGDQSNREYREEISKRMPHAQKTFQQARVQHARQAVDKVVDGTATPYEQDVFNEWFDDLTFNVGFEPSRREDGDDKHHQWLDQQMQQLQDVAIKAGEKGKKDIAEKAMRAINECGRTKEQRIANRRAKAAEEAKFQQQATTDWDQKYRDGLIDVEGNYTEKYFQANPWARPQTTPSLFPSTDKPTTPTLFPGITTPGGYGGGLFGGRPGIGKRPGSEMGGMRVPFGMEDPTRSTNGNSLFPGLTPPSSGIGGFGGSRIDPNLFRRNDPPSNDW